MCLALGGAESEKPVPLVGGRGRKSSGQRGVEVGKKLSRVQGGRQGMGKRMYFRSGWCRCIHGRVTGASYSEQQMAKMTKNNGKRLHLAKIIRDGPFQ